MRGGRKYLGKYNAPFSPKGDFFIQRARV